MKSQLLDNYIFELLVKHNCVIMPNFGGFISNYRSAYYNEAKQIYFPASRAISFNKNLLNNDGLLIQAFAKENELTLVEAESEVEKAIINYKSQLDKDKRVSFNKIGVLFFDLYGKLHFIPDLNQNFQENSFGFLPEFALDYNRIKSVEIEKNQSEENDSANIIKLEPKPISEINQDNSKVFHLENRLSKIASIAAIVMIIVASAFWIGKSDSSVKLDQFNLSALIPEKISFFYNTPYKLNSYSPSPKITLEKEDSKTYDFEILTKAIRLNKGKAFKFNFEHNEIANENGIWVKASDDNPSISDKENGFFLVAGCFSILENAEKLQMELADRGFSSARIFDFENGLYRVSFSGPYESYFDAKNELHKIKKTENSSAWITKKIVR